MSQHRTGPDSEYADRPMFAHLATLEPGTSEFVGQRDAIIKRCLPWRITSPAASPTVASPSTISSGGARGAGQPVNRFDVQAGPDFLSFAVPTMMGEVRRYFRDYSWSLKVPRRFKDLTTPSTGPRGTVSHVGARPERE